MTVMQQLQQQVTQTAAENQQLRDRLTTFEQQQQFHSPTHGGGAQAVQVGEVLAALGDLPEALTKMSRPKGLIDSRGLGRPQVLGDDAENRFRPWAIKLEDYVSGVFGGKSREALEWAASMDKG